LITEYIKEKGKIEKLMQLIMEVKEKDLNRFNKSYLVTRIDKNRVNVYFKITDTYQVYFSLISKIKTHTEKDIAYG